jgi:hypothetical protein
LTTRKPSTAPSRPGVRSAVLLSDGTVTLRPSDERDLAAIRQGIDDPETVRWFGRRDASAADVLALNTETRGRGISNVFDLRGRR